MSARILLFGSTGQVGGRLLQTLGDESYEVMAMDRASCDLSVASEKEIASRMRALEPQLVINATAYNQVDPAEDDTQLAMRINGAVPTLMASVCAEQHLPFLHFSSDYVFDGMRGAPYDESATTNPLNAYAASKLAGEQGARSHGGTVFRLQWVFDARGKNFFLTMKKLMVEREELRVVADQLGAPSYALHIAQAVSQAVPKLMDGRLPAGVYHLAAGGHTSWHGFACAIAAATHSSARVVPVVSQEYACAAKRPLDTRLNCDVLASHGIAMPHWREGFIQAMSDTHANS